jgi:hypothetical protein
MQRKELSIAERCIPWHPIPAYANQWFAIGVARFEIRSLSTQDIATAIVFAPKPGDASTYHGLDAWRITFEHVLAVRFGPFPAWEGATQPPRPLDFEAGVWEVVDATWLEEFAPAHNWPVRHFVLTYNDALHEVAAVNWQSYAVGP